MSNLEELLYADSYDEILEFRNFRSGFDEMLYNSLDIIAKDKTQSFTESLIFEYLKQVSDSNLKDMAEYVKLLYYIKNEKSGTLMYENLKQFLLERKYLNLREQIKEGNLPKDFSSWYDKNILSKIEKEVFLKERHEMEIYLQEQVIQYNMST